MWASIAMEKLTAGQRNTDTRPNGPSLLDTSVLKEMRRCFSGTLAVPSRRVRASMVGAQPQKRPLPSRTGLYQPVHPSRPLARSQELIHTGSLR